MSGLAILSAGATHVGCVRSHNEDAYALLPEFGLWVVADGMGGHAAGDVASRIVVEELASLGIAVSAEDQRARLHERLDRANRRILDHAAAHGLGTMGSTLVALLIHGAQMTSAWAGDSRAYLLREGALHPLTRDHSEVEALIAAGALTEAEARVSPRRNVITRAVGIGEDCTPEIASGLAQAGDRLLLCSDGVTEHLTDAEIAAALARPGPPQAAADGLVAEVLARGARDNVTAVVIDCAVGAAGAEDAAW